MKYYLIFAVLLVFGSCSKDSSVDDNRTIEVEQRFTESTPNFQIKNGMVYFPSLEDYHSTLSYLSNASEDEIDYFDNEMSIQTVAKKLTEFENYMDELGDETEVQTSEIINNWDDVVKFVPLINENGETEYEVKPIMALYTHITNIEHVFQISTTVIKQVNGKLVSITKPDVVNHNTITEDVETDHDEGTYVTDIETRGDVTDEDGLVCESGCPSFNSETNQSSNRRVVMHHLIQDVTKYFADPFDSRFTLVMPEVQIENIGRRQKRRAGIWFKNKGDLTYNIENEYNWHFHIPDVPTLPETVTQNFTFDQDRYRTNVSRIEHNFNIPSPDFYSRVRPRAPELHECIRIDHFFFDQIRSVEYQCD